MYAFAAELYPDSRYAFWGIAVLLFPWLIVRALSFNARNSAYRGLRFDFPATGNEAAKVYIGKLAVAVLTLGFGFPWFMARQKAFVVSHHAFGAARFHCELSGRQFFGIYARSALMLFVVGTAVGILYAVAIPALTAFDSLHWLVWLVPAAVMYAGYAVAYAYVQARTTNLLWTNTSGPGFEFESSLSAKKLVRLYFGNILAVACSAGLLIPWAVIRTLRYRLENLSITIDDEFTHTASLALPPVGATGQELGDLFNLDLGI